MLDIFLFFIQFLDFDLIFSDFLPRHLFLYHWFYWLYKALCNIGLKKCYTNKLHYYYYYKAAMLYCCIHSVNEESTRWDSLQHFSVVVSSFIPLKYTNCHQHNVFLCRLTYKPVWHELLYINTHNEVSARDWNPTLNNKEYWLWQELAPSVLSQYMMDNGTSWWLTGSLSLVWTGIFYKMNDSLGRIKTQQTYVLPSWSHRPVLPSDHCFCSAPLPNYYHQLLTDIWLLSGQPEALLKKPQSIWWQKLVSFLFLTC